jgi:hypothetical protein
MITGTCDPHHQPSDTCNTLTNNHQHPFFADGNISIMQYGRVRRLFSQCMSHLFQSLYISRCWGLQVRQTSHGLIPTHRRYKRALLQLNSFYNKTYIEK